MHLVIRGGGDLDRLPVEWDAGDSSAEGGGEAGVVFLSGGCDRNARKECRWYPWAVVRTGRGGRCIVVGEVHSGWVVDAGGVAREGVAGLVPHAWYVDHAEPVSQGLLLEVPQACVRDVLKRPVPKQLAQWFMVDRNDQVIAAEHKVAGLVEGVRHS